MEDIGTYRKKYIRPAVDIILVSGLTRICAASGEFGSDGIDIPGMKDNDW